MAQADQIETLAGGLFQLYRRAGMFDVLHYDVWADAGGRVRRMAKAAGMLPELVEACLRGETAPTTGQALAMIRALPYIAADTPAPELNGAAG